MRYILECFDCGTRYEVADNQDIQRALRHKCKVHRPILGITRLAWIIIEVVEG